MHRTLYFPIAIGGGFGACLRYLISITFPSPSGFPVSTLLVNLIGCFLLSLCYQSFANHPHRSLRFHKALTTGLIGSFTTFSAFTAQFVRLLDVQIGAAVLYLFLTVFGGLSMTWLGLKVGSR